MTNDAKQTHKPSVICFIDDDQDELQRFKAAMEEGEKAHFICITGEGYEDCKRQLDERKLKPDLWVLDMFFPVGGRVNTSEERVLMNDKYAELQARVQEFRTFLHNIGQSPDGGIELLKTCLKRDRSPVAMFTRKGTLDDAIRCIDEGAVAVLKKPMPSEWPENSAEKREKLDEAMLQNRPYLSDKFHQMILANRLWNKHKGKIGLVGGAGIAAGIRELISWIF